MFDFSGGGNSAQINATMDRVQNEFSWNGGSCVELDRLILKVRDRVVAERLKPSAYNYGLNNLVPKYYNPNDIRIRSRNIYLSFSFPLN